MGVLLYIGYSIAFVLMFLSVSFIYGRLRETAEDEDERVRRAIEKSVEDFKKYKRTRK